MQKAKKNCDVKEDKDRRHLSKFKACAFPQTSDIRRYISQKFTKNSMNAILVYLRGRPIWRPENSVNIWSLVSLSRRLIICTEQTSIHISTFPNALSSKRAQNHEVSIYFSTNLIVACCHAPT